MQRLRETYEKEAKPKLSKKFEVDNEMALPKITKVVVNTGVGEAVNDKGVLEQSKKDLAMITGQTPLVRRAKVSVASFGVRLGMPVGVAVTLRGDKMYAFLDKLFSIVLPRLRDFRGLSTESFDKHGNYTLGIAEHSVFPEIDLSQAKARGLEITIVTSTNDVEEAKTLLESLGMPFRKEEEE